MEILLYRYTDLPKILGLEVLQARLDLKVLQDQQEIKADLVLELQALQDMEFLVRQEQV
jgi:hypothetical protein